MPIKISSSIAAVSLALCFVTRPASGISHDHTLLQLQHTGWTVREGAPASIYDLAQTRDGQLWLATASGLYRFDGVRFERYELQSGEKNLSEDVSSLRATTNGGLWIGFRVGGASFLKDGRITRYEEAEGFPRGTVYGFAELDGVVWAAASGGLGRLEGSRWRRIGEDWGYPSKPARCVFADREGNLWVVAEHMLVFLPPGTKMFRPAGIQVGLVRQIAQAPNGKLWMAELSRSVRPIPIGGNRPPSDDTEVRVGSSRILFDREGALWITTVGDGMRRIPAPERLKGKLGRFSDLAESFTAKEGLTADIVRCILEDHEGNVWVATENGLDRFRETSIKAIQIRAMLAGGEQGDDWTGITPGPKDTLIHIPGRAPIEHRFLSGMTAGYRAANGVTWWGNREGIWRVANGRVTPIPLPDGAAKDFDIQAITEDHSENLWVSIIRSGVFQWANGTWKRFGNLPYPPPDTPMVLITDSRGRVWFGYAGRRGVAVLDENKVTTFTRENGLQVVSVYAMHERAGHIWIGGERGLALFDGTRFHTLIADGVAFGGITGIVETAGGDLWLNAAPGIVRVPSEELRRAIQDPSHRVHCEVLTYLDGLVGDAGSFRPVPTAVASSDGRLWIRTTGSLVEIDPAHLSRNTIKPPVFIRSMDSEGKTYTPSPGTMLPARTTSLHIAYTALSYSVPERVRFRYKLEGLDKDWQDAGTRREAFYTNLRPGPYIFRVIACNNDDLWNEAGAVLNFAIAPAYYQTMWFLLLSVALGVAAIVAVIRLRVRQVTAGINARFDERLDERTRIARQFHDTLIQTIQGSKIVAHDALRAPADPIRMHRALDLLDGWLGRAVEEGRSALNSLRTSTAEKDGLAEAFQHAGEECMLQRSIAFGLSVEGAAQEIHPIVRDEVYRIGNEAIRNACAHSEASRLDVELSYVYDLTIRVRDNGKGIAPEVAAKGKKGHFGLIGMRERASRIRGKLTLSSAPGGGTVVELVVPRKIAFRQPNSPR